MSATPDQIKIHGQQLLEIWLVETRKYMEAQKYISVEDFKTILAFTLSAFTLAMLEQGVPLGKQEVKP